MRMRSKIKRSPDYRVALSLLAVLLLSFSIQTHAQPLTRALTLEGAVAAAVAESPASIRAQNELRENLLMAANLEHQHRLGPPGGMSINIRLDPIPLDDFDLDLPVEWGLPDELEIPPISIPLGGPSPYEKAQVERLLPVQFAGIRSMTESAFTQRMNAVRSEVIETYYQVQLAEAAVELVQASLERLQLQRTQTRLLLQQGVIPALDLERLEAAVVAVEAEHFAAKERAALAHMRMNQKMGLSLDAPRNLITPVEVASLPEMDLVLDQAKARSHSAELAALASRLQVAEKEYELYKEFHGTFSQRRAYREKTLEIEKIQLEIAAAQTQLDFGLHALMSQLKQKDQQRDAQRMQVRVAQRVLSANQLRYSAGLGTIIEVLEAEDALRQAELELKSLEVDVQVSLAHRDTLLGQGLDVQTQYEEITREIDELR